MKVIYHPEADRELVDAAHYYQSKQNGLGSEFLDEVNAAVESILHDPHRLPSVDVNISRQFVKRFPFEIYFRILGDDSIRILAVKHHRRDPDYGRTRR